MNAVHVAFLWRQGGGWIVAGAAAVASGGRRGDRPRGGPGDRAGGVRDGVGARDGDVLLGGRDEAGRRLAAVQLAELKAATQKQIAAASGTDPVTVWRWADAYRRAGVAGLLPAWKGPKGPSKLTPGLTEKIRKQGAAGKSQAAIAAGTGVSTFAVRTALGRVPARRQGAGLGAGCAAGAAGPGAAGRRAGAGPVRAARRGRGARVHGGARYPLADCSWRCPLAGTGLIQTARSVWVCQISGVRAFPVSFFVRSQKDLRARTRL